MKEEDRGTAAAREATARQHASMPKVSKPDQCARMGITECADETCSHFARGCPMGGRKPVPSTTPQKET